MSPQQKVHPNQGHRKRLRERFLRDGPEGLPPHNFLELLLSFVIPRKDTNRIAHDLLERFGTVRGVLEASPDALKSVKGVGDQTAVFLKCVGQSGAYYESLWNAPALYYQETLDFVAYLEKCFLGVPQEQLIILYLNRSGKLLNKKQITIGSEEALILDERMVLDGAMDVHASHIVFAHNHPGGLPIPSHADAAMTNRLCVHLKAVGLTVLDHIIFAGAEYVSMQEMGYISAAKR